MQLTAGVEWAVHCVVFLANLPDGAALSADRLAEQHGVPRPYLAKTLQALSRAGLVGSRAGRRGGYFLTHPSDQITLLDVVLAVEGDEPAFRCTEIRQRGPNRVAARLYPPRCGIAAAMDRAEAAWRAELATVTVADLGRVAVRQAPAVAQTKTRAWLEQALH